jgi:putative ABC transport system permease protein
MVNVVILSIFAVVIIVIAALAIRRRVLFKMGARNFVRHRTHSMLVVAGLLIGVSIISGAMVTGDSINNFIVKNTYDSLDIVDVEVATNRSTYFNESIYSELSNDPGVLQYSDAIAPTIFTFVSVEDITSGQFEPISRIIGFDSDQDRDFGAFTTVEGSVIYGDDLGNDEVMLNQNTAEKLDASTGDVLKVRYLPQNELFGRESNFTVGYIVKDEGKAQYNLGMNIFVRLDVAQQMLNATGQINLIRISGPGDMETGVEKSDELVNAVERVLLTSSDPTAAGVVAMPVKDESLEQSKQAGEMFTMFITIFGSFSIIAGVILIVNIFTMLAEERKSELGMARAMGMTRSDLMQMFLFEGSTYSIAAAALGTLTGLLVAGGLIFGMNTIFAIGDFSGIPFHFEVSSLINAFCLGTIITLLTIVAASWRVTKINIVRAIRDIPEPVFDRATMKVVLMGGILTALMLALFALAFDNVVIRYVAPCMALFGVAFIIRGFASARVAYSFTGVGLIVYTLYSITSFFTGTDESVQYLFIVSGVFLVLAAVMIVMFNSSLVVRGISGSFGRLRSMRPIVKTAISHPLNKKFRTGMTVAMFALVIYTIVMISVFSNVFSLNIDEQVETQGGGYHVIGRTQVPQADLDNAFIIGPPPLSQPIWINSTTLDNDVANYEQISTVFPGPEITIDGEPIGGGPTGFGPAMGGLGIVAVDDQFIQNNRYEFSDMLDEYSTPDEVWDSVRTNESRVIFSGMMFGPMTSYGVGTNITIETVTGKKDFMIAGQLDQFLLPGIFMTKDHALTHFNKTGTFIGNTIFLFEVKDGLDIQTVTLDLERDFRALGMDTTNIKATIESGMEMMNSFFLLFEIFLGLGLIVGIAGLGVITIRSVVERRQEIGIMRAIGFEKRMILGSFIIEILLVATLGIVIGIGIGLVVSYQIFTTMVTEVDVSFSIPWVQLMYIIVITYVASLICTITPAVRASRIPPVEALRFME